MLDSDKMPFAQSLATTFAVYSRPTPDSNTMRVWFSLLSKFELRDVQAALEQYLAKEPKFPPTPAAIRELLGANQSARIGADEAWALALASCDEAETVVWTNEIAEAFATCRPVLDRGDEVGARMAFKDAYARITSAAVRAGCEPVWQASLGFDPERRAEALRRAGMANLLPAGYVAAMLPPPEPEMTREQFEIARENTARIKAMLAEAMANKMDHQALRAQAERDRVAALKADAEAKARAYGEANGYTIH